MPITMEYTMEDQDEAVHESEINEEAEEDNSESEVEEQEEDETLVVSIGEDDPDEDDLSIEKEDDTDTIKQMRKALKEKNDTSKAERKELKELKAKQAERDAAKAEVELGDKPKADDYDYGQQEQFETDLIAWNDRKRTLKNKEQSKKDESAAADQRYQDRLSMYKTNSAALGVADFSEVEEVVKGKFSVQQHAIAVHALDKPELFILAVGKNKKVLDRLADIKDPVIFAVEIGKIEAKLKTTKRKSPQPETRLSGTAVMSGSTDKHLEKLERDSEKSGDRTKILAYKREQRERKEA